MPAEILVLGAAQDGGVPQIGCNCTNCASAKDINAPHYAVCLAIVDRASGQSWLIDCGPDIKPQYDMLMDFAPECKLQGVLLTHLHIGHYIGLHQFGKEALNTTALKIYGTKSVCSFFRNNLPWSFSLERGTFMLEEIEAGTRKELSTEVAVTAVEVPHRQEFSDTVAFYVHGQSKTALWCPDIDSWA
eukprot:gene12439-15639_t